VEKTETHVLCARHVSVSLTVFVIIKQELHEFIFSATDSGRLNTQGLRKFCSIDNILMKPPPT
jgi:hypothetical protein